MTSEAVRSLKPMPMQRYFRIKHFTSCGNVKRRRSPSQFEPLRTAKTDAEVHTDCRIAGSSQRKPLMSGKRWLQQNSSWHSSLINLLYVRKTDSVDWSFLPLLNELEWNVKTSSLLEFAGQMRLFADADLSVGSSSQMNVKCDSEWNGLK